MPETSRRVRATAETLRSVDLFRDLDARARARIADRCRAGLYPAEHRLIEGGDPTTDVYFVVSGRVRVTIHSRAGKEVTFRDIGPGGLFGDLSAIDGKPRSATVVTLSESCLLRLSAAGFWDLLESHPPIARTVLLELASLVRRLTERVFEFSTLAANNRLHAELLRLAREHGDESTPVEIAPAPTHAEIASRISSHREAVTREMNRLSRMGLIERQRGRLLIRDVARLARMVGEVKGE